MDEFIYHFETLVKERKGQILDFDASPSFEYSCALLPYKSLIHNHEGICGGIAMSFHRKKVSLSTYFQRDSCSYGIIKPLNLSLFKSDFHPYELELFVIDLFSQIDYLKLFEVEAAAQKIREAKSSSYPISLSTLSQWVNKIVYRQDTEDILRHYIEEEDQKGLNPLGIYGKRVRRVPILDRFDAANAVGAMAGDINNPHIRWKLMELGGRIIWNQKIGQEVASKQTVIANLYQNRNFLTNPDD